MTHARTIHAFLLTLLPLSSFSQSNSQNYIEEKTFLDENGRGIANIDYDLWGNPLWIQFTNGNVTSYVYTAEGIKLKTIHYIAMPNIVVPKNTTHTLNDKEILGKNVIDYLNGGTVILQNGAFYEYRFGEGFCRRTYTSGKDSLSFHYYNKDHLGNIREVVNENGSLEEINNYYPFGMPYYEGKAAQKFTEYQLCKYNGKELDRLSGLNTYDHGARQNYATLGVWDRVDPMAEKYYSISPYAACGNNPILYKDIMGDTLTLLGENEEITSTSNLMNQYANDTYKLDDKGNIECIKRTGHPNAYDELFNKVIDDNNNTKINVVGSSQEISIADAKTSTIDIEDIYNIGDKDIVNSGSILAHEIYEQYLIQTKRTSLNKAHLKASNIEPRLTNSGYIIPFNGREQSTSSIIIKGIKPINHKGKIVKIKIKNGNVIK